MNSAFHLLYTQLGRITFGVLLAAISIYGLTLLCALLGLVDAVISFRGVAASLAYGSAALLVAFLAASLVAAIARWGER